MIPLPSLPARENSAHHIPNPYIRCVLVNSSPLNALSSPVPKLFTAAAVSEPLSVFLRCPVASVGRYEVARCGRARAG